MRWRNETGERDLNGKMGCKFDQTEYRDWNSTRRTRPDQIIFYRPYAVSGLVLRIALRRLFFGGPACSSARRFHRLVFVLKPVSRFRRFFVLLLQPCQLTSIRIAGKCPVGLVQVLARSDRHHDTHCIAVVCVGIFIHGYIICRYVEIPHDAAAQANP